MLCWRNLSHRIKIPSKLSSKAPKVRLSLFSLLSPSILSHFLLVWFYSALPFHTQEWKGIWSVWTSSLSFKIISTSWKVSKLLLRFLIKLYYLIDFLYFLDKTHTGWTSFYKINQFLIQIQSFLSQATKRKRDKERLADQFSLRSILRLLATTPFLNISMPSRR